MRKPLVLVLLVALLTLQYLVAFVNFEFWWNDTVIAGSFVATLAIGLIEARYLLKEWLDGGKNARADRGRDDESMQGAFGRSQYGKLIVVHHVDIRPAEHTPLAPRHRE